MRTLMKITLQALFLLVLSGCSHSIHQVYVSSMDKSMTYGEGSWVTASSSDRVILGFQGDSNYVETAYLRLQSKCNGRLSQVTTEYLTSFLFLSYDQKLILRGLCRRK